jgi:uncharacterized zinc-type alcohol dehydrogenase-like protein
MSTTLTKLRVKGYAAHKAGAALAPFSFERREPGEHDIVIDILYCGICHTDIHQVRNEWGGSVFPMVPGHEIVGWVSRVGAKVKRFKPSDPAGVGCFVDSCRVCSNCKAGLEQYCEQRTVFTYNSPDRDGKVTYGGYSSQIVVDENYALKIAPKQPLERVAPLLCAGITTYSPIKHWKMAAGHRVGVLGLGGLGHMAVKIAAAKGAEVVVLSTSDGKSADARRLGAQQFVLTTDPSAMTAQAGKLDFIIDTVSAPHDLNLYLKLLKSDGVMVLLGVPPKPPSVETFELIGRRRSLAGSMIGGIAETQEMLDYCAEKKITADVEMVPISKVNDAYERMLKGDVRYRFVIDMKSLQG